MAFGAGIKRGLERRGGGAVGVGSRCGDRMIGAVFWEVGEMNVWESVFALCFGVKMGIGTPILRAERWRDT